MEREEEGRQQEIYRNVSTNKWKVAACHYNYAYVGVDYETLAEGHSCPRLSLRLATRHSNSRELKGSVGGFFSSAPRGFACPAAVFFLENAIKTRSVFVFTHSHALMCVVTPAKGNILPSGTSVEMI